MDKQTHLTPGERLQQLETTVQTLTKQTRQQLETIQELTETVRTMFGLFQILPELLNQNMPAVRAAEVRKFKNHMDYVSMQHITRLNPVEQQES